MAPLINHVQLSISLPLQVYLYLVQCHDLEV